MKNIKSFADKLIKISDIIIKEIDILANLSYHSQENSNQFKEHITDIKNYLEIESYALDDISLSEIKELYNYLLDNDDMSDGYARTIISVEERLNEINLDNSIDEEINDNDTQDEETINEADMFPEEYMMDTNETNKNQQKATDYIATIAIKRMADRIKNVYTDNKNDAKYKERLIKYFNYFKYYYFTIDSRLERQGVNNNFDINKMPTISYDYINTLEIFNNECVNIINDIYNVNNTEYNLENISVALFKMLSFEEYLARINDEYIINNLLNMCYKMEELKPNSFYGNIIKSKILLKKKD